MNKRETVLTAVVAVLVLLVLGRMGLRRIDALETQRKRRLAAVQKQLDDRRSEFRRTQQAATRLSAWQQRSLPANRDLAHGLYRQWLAGRLAESQLADVNITSTTSASRAGNHQQIGFAVTARGNLEQLTKFLYAFYRADHLHKLRSFHLTPGADPEQLELRLIIEALSLQGADHIDRLSTATSPRLAHRDLATYVQAIAGRKPFAPQVPSGADAANSEASARSQVAGGELAGQIFVTSLMDDGAKPQVWLLVRTTGRVLKLHPGEHFKVEDLSGTIAAIHLRPREVIIATGGRQLRVALGSSLSEGTEIAETQSHHPAAAGSSRRS